MYLLIFKYSTQYDGSDLSQIYIESQKYMKLEHGMLAMIFTTIEQNHDNSNLLNFRNTYGNLGNAFEPGSNTAY